MITIWMFGCLKFFLNFPPIPDSFSVTQCSLKAKRHVNTLLLGSDAVEIYNIKGVHGNKCTMETNALNWVTFKSPTLTDL